MSSQRCTRSVTGPSSARRRGPAVGTTPSATVSPASSAAASVVVGRRGESCAVVDRQPARPGAAEQVERRPGGAASGPTARRPPRRSPSSTQRERGAAPRAGRPSGAGRSPDAVGTRPGQHRGAAPARRPAPPAGRRRAAGGAGRRRGGDALGQRLRQLAPGAVVGEHLVAARLLDGRGERPRPGDLGLERAGVALRLLLDLVEVLGEQRLRARRWSTPGARR